MDRIVKKRRLCDVKNVNQDQQTISQLFVKMDSNNDVNKITDNINSGWNCQFCTFLNMTNTLRCEMCTNERPQSQQNLNGMNGLFDKLSISNSPPESDQDKGGDDDVWDLSVYSKTKIQKREQD